MPAEVIVCLTNGVGDTCCLEESGDGCPIRDRKSANEPCYPEDESSCSSSQDEGEKLPIIVKECSCCVVIKNSQDSLDQTRLVGHLGLPPVALSLDTSLAVVSRLQRPQDTRGMIHDPPRRLPLII